MKRYTLFLFTAVYGCMLFSQNIDLKSDARSTSTEGEFFTRYVYSPGLESNLLGDSPNREVWIYLPPGYNDDPQKRYPVIYFLHGVTERPGVWDAVDGIMNTLISQGTVSPMIAVCPNSYNGYTGSNYTNSSVTGNWEDFIVQDVIKYIDRNFRSLPQSDSRGIAGFSMGGYGTFKLAMKHPDIYSSAYGMSSAKLIFEDAFLDRWKSSLITAVCTNPDYFESLGWMPQYMIACAAAFAPNPSMKFYAEFPVTKYGELIDSVWQKWLQHDPYTLLPVYKDNLLKLNAIQFDCGTGDLIADIDDNIRFSQELTNHEIDHVFETYDGGHSIYPTRLQSKVLPFFSTYLADTMLRDTVLYDLIPCQLIEVYEHSDSVGIIPLDTTLYECDSISYSLIAGNPYNVFTLDSLTGVISADPVRLDYETFDRYHDLLVTARYKYDSVLIVDTGNVSIEVKNIYEPLLVVRDTIFGIEENSLAGTTIGQIPYDNPEGLPLSFTIIDGNINGTFTMDIFGLGIIRIANADSLNFESNPAFILTIAVEELQGGICKDTVTVTINLTVSTFDKDETKFEIFPNPANDIITVRTGYLGQYYVEITNLYGQILFRSISDGPQNSIDLSSFSKGAYFVNVRTRDNVSTYKIIKL